MKLSCENMARNVGRLFEIIVGDQYSPEEPHLLFLASFHLSLASLAMQQRASLSLNLFPSYSLYFAGLNLMQTAHDLLVPCGVHILVNGGVQTRGQVARQLVPFFLELR